MATCPGSYIRSRKESVKVRDLIMSTSLEIRAQSIKLLVTVGDDLLPSVELHLTAIKFPLILHLGSEWLKHPYLTWSSVTLFAKTHNNP